MPVAGLMASLAWTGSPGGVAGFLVAGGVSARAWVSVHKERASTASSKETTVIGPAWRTGFVDAGLPSREGTVRGGSPRRTRRRSTAFSETPT